LSIHYARSNTPQKRKRNNPVVVHHQAQPPFSALDTTKPTAIFQKPTHGRTSTLTIALPGSIISNAQTPDLKTALAGQIARACAVFCVDEIIIFNDGQNHASTHQSPYSSHQSNPQQQGSYRARERAAELANDPEYTGFSDPDHFLYHLLSYLETPPFLRKWLFPLHSNLRTAGALPSLDMPHHLRSDEWCEYREGVTIGPAGADAAGSTTNGGAASKKRKNADHTSTNGASTGTLVEVGLSHPITLPISIPPDTRVTVKLPTSLPADLQSTDLRGEAVDPATPREEGGYYWGFSVRQASTLSAVFTESPFAEGYDVSMGTSERGVPLTDILPMPPNSADPADSILDAAELSARLPAKYEHMLLVFGGVAGLEVAAAADEELKARGIEKENVGELFDAWVNLVPGQGSRTVRTEEAVWCGLMGVESYVRAQGA